MNRVDVGAAKSVLKVDRRQALAYRVEAQGLHRDDRQVADLAILDIGVQEAMGQPAAYAFAARLPGSVDLSPGAVPIGPDDDLALAWTLRGAPHVHRRSDLDALSAALWPLSEADATGRLNETGPSIARAGIAALEQFALAVDAMRAVVDEPIGKGAASTALTALLPASMGRDCRGCNARHVSDSAMRSAALAAGVELEPGTSPPVLVRRRPTATATASTTPSAAASPLAALVSGYLRLLGPAGPAEAAGYLDVRRADLVALGWPSDLVEVDIDGRTCWITADRVDALRSPREPDPVRLLGPFDPFVQARDRALLVPDTSLHKALWPVLGRPGVLLVDGEIAGCWRTKSSSTLTLTVETFGPLPDARWAEVEAEAARVAEVRGASDVAVIRKSG